MRESLLNPKERFEKLVITNPILSRFYHPVQKTIDIRQAENLFYKGERRQKILLAFLKVVYGRNSWWFCDIDEIEILKEMDLLWPEDHRLIAGWAADPFYLDQTRN